MQWRDHEVRVHEVEHVARESLQEEKGLKIKIVKFTISSLFNQFHNIRSHKTGIFLTLWLSLPQLVMDCYCGDNTVSFSNMQYMLAYVNNVHLCLYVVIFMHKCTSPKPICTTLTNPIPKPIRVIVQPYYQFKTFLKVPPSCLEPETFCILAPMLSLVATEASDLPVFHWPVHSKTMSTCFTPSHFFKECII